MSMNPEIKLEILETGLKHLFRKKHFSICDIDSLLTLTGTIPDRETYQGLHALHCVDYNEMSPKLRGWLFNESIGLFANPGFPLESMQPIRESLPGSFQ